MLFFLLKPISWPCDFKLSSVFEGFQWLHTDGWPWGFSYGYKLIADLEVFSMATNWQLTLRFFLWLQTDGWPWGFSYGYKLMADLEAFPMATSWPWGYLLLQAELSKRYQHHIPAPKMPLPGHAESYNPPPEYLLTEEEVSNCNIYGNFVCTDDEWRCFDMGS